MEAISVPVAQTGLVEKSFFQRLRDWLAEPLVEMGEVDKRNARLLAWITLAFTVALILRLFYVVSLEFLLAMAMTVVAYGLSRTRFYQLGVILLSLMLSFPTFMNIATAGHPLISQEISASMMWLVTPVLVAAVLLKFNQTAIVAGLLVAASWLVLMFTPYATLINGGGGLGFLAVSSVVVLIMINHRNQQELIRQRELAAKTEALVRAEEADKLKSQFLASMSHELRTPLNAILNFNEMMMLGMVGEVSDQQRDLLGKSFDSAKHLLDLINDVLDISKMQGDMLSLFVEDDVDLSRELSKVLDAAGSLLKDRDIKLETDIDETLPMISGDKRRIRQILLNLISNAVKFTEVGTITVSAKHKDDRVLFAVIDSGPGISAEEQAIIFEPFVQTEAGIKHQGGTGLGLPISRRLAELHGGRLWVESTPGEGASFFVSLPIELPDAVRKARSDHD